MSKWVIGKYIRLSRADQDLMKKESKTESESISNQRSLIQNYIDQNEELCDAVQYEFFDDGYSGTNFNRPSFERLIEKVKKREINCIIVKDFSRFGRNYIELGDYMERIFPFLGVRFISINDHYDSNDYKGTTGGLDMVMKNIVYDYYSKDLSIKVKTSKYQKMKNGLYCGGHVPYGLMKSPLDKHKLVMDPDAADVVRDIFHMAIAKVSLTNIARILNERGVETPGVYYRRKHPDSKKFGNISGEICWNHSTVGVILKQEMYYGAVVGHKRQKIHVGSKQTVQIPKDERFIVEDQHEGIVTKEEFVKAQEIFKEKRVVKRIIPKTYPLYRKVKCAVCGRAMTYSRRSFGETQYKYFGCSHAGEHIKEYEGQRKYVPEDDLNMVVWAVMKQMLDITGVFASRLNKQNAFGRERNVLLAAKLSKLQRDKEKCESDRFANVDQFMAGRVDKELYQVRRAELGRLEDQLNVEIQETEQKLKEAEKDLADINQTISVMKRFATAEELTQNMVQAFIEKVIVTDPEHVEIVWKFKNKIANFMGN